MRSAGSLVVLVACGLCPSLARAAEGEEELIDDPLSTAPKPAPEASKATGSSESGGAAKPSDSSSPHFHLDVWLRAAADTHWTRDDVVPALGEDVVRERLWTTLGVSGGAPTGVRYVLETRLVLENRAKRAGSGNGWPLDRASWLYEALVTAAFVDVPLGERVRARVGEQVVTWGRMDLASAADVLERRDLREPPSADPSGARLPTPTVRLDVHASDAIDATLAWTVVAMPHRFELLGSSWALLGPGVLGGAGGALRDRLAAVAAATDQTTFTRVQQGLVDASTPAARPDGGELAARVDAHLGGADVGLTYGWVRTKLPVIDVDPVLRDFRGEIADGVALLRALNEGRPLIGVSYPRYHQLALDLEGTAGPLTLSWELGYTPKRPLYVRDASGFPVRADAGLAQIGVRAQWASDDTLIAAEADVFEVTGAPPDGAGPWLGFGPHRSLAALLATADTKIGDRLHVGLGALTTTSGPSLALLPRAGWELDDAWTLGLAASFFPRLRTSPAREGLTLADTLHDRDFVEASVRYRR